MDDQAYGAVTEGRFLRLMSKRVDSTPPWYLHTEKAAYEWDHRGIDFFVYISHKEGGDPVKVPVQIKSSDEGARLFRLKHSSRQVNNIMVLVIARFMADEDVLRTIYTRLGYIRECGKRFDGYYALEIAKAESYWRPK